MTRRGDDDRDLERRLRQALSARASSVQPDPATWQVVRRRIRRVTWLRAGGTGLVTAAVVAMAVLLLPGAMRPARQIDFAATAPPSSTPPTPIPSAAPTATEPAVGATAPTPPAEAGTEPPAQIAPEPTDVPSPEPAEGRPTQAPVESPGDSEAPAERMAAVSVAFLPPEASCGEAIVLVERQVPALTPLRGALEALLAGPAEAEAALGYSTVIGGGPGLLHGVSIRDGLATVDLAAAALPGTSGSSCQILGVTEQLDATVGQFTAVDRVTYRIDGSTERFAAWAQSPPDEYTDRPVP